MKFPLISLSTYQRSNLISGIFLRYSIPLSILTCLIIPTSLSFAMQSYYFYPAVNLTNNSITNSAPHLAMDDSYYLHLSYKQWDGNDHEIYYMCNTAGSWSPPEQVTDDTLDNKGSGIAIDYSGHAHIVWYDSSDGEFDVYYINNKSGSWSNLTCISKACPGNDYNPSIAVDSSGYAHAVWFDTYESDDIYYAYDGPGGWSSATNITNTGGG